MILIEVFSARSSSDWLQIRNLCCLTGKDGEPIASGSDWGSFAERWIGPYQKFLPTWSYVLKDSLNSTEISGYLTGCPDSQWLERQKPLVQKMKAFFKSRSKSTPYDYFSRETHKTLKSEYPAHLHINLSKSCRGKGMGKLLIDRFFIDLKAHQIKGVHVFCGSGPVRFYESVGFRSLEMITYKNTNVFALIKRL